MKKLIISFIFLFIFSTSAQAFDTSKLEVRNVLLKHELAYKQRNIDKMMSYYDKEYKNKDGFNVEELKEMLEKTMQAYSNIKYKTKINNISIYDDTAVVQMSDSCHADIYSELLKSKKLKKEKKGVLEGKSSYVVYLKKKDNNWKITYEDIVAEETSLKYGIANKIKMNINTPLLIKEGETYDISLVMEKPKDVIALASLSNEEIKYPTPDLKEKYRKLPSEGELERIVTANSTNNNEYAIATIGFTTISVDEELSKARIQIIGMAYLMKRINKGK